MAGIEFLMATATSEGASLANFIADLFGGNWEESAFEFTKGVVQDVANVAPWGTPWGKVWHHSEIMGVMYEVPKSEHRADHTGAAKFWEVITGGRYEFDYFK